MNIAVRGIGIISALGNGAGETLAALRAGRSGIGKPTLFRSAVDVPVGEVRRDNRALGELLGIPARETPSRTALLGMIAAAQAVADAGIVDNAKLVDGSGIRVGDKIVGLASTGLHSNGFSLARKILDKSGLGPDDPFPGADGATVRDVLLAPTQIYVEVVRSLLRDLDVRGMAHITGGGFYDNIPRVLPNQVEAHIDFGSWEMPPVFKWLHEVGELSWPEILQIFNGGIGYVLVLPEEQVEETINRIQAFGMSAWSIGTIARRNGDGEQVVVNFDKA